MSNRVKIPATCSLFVFAVSLACIISLVLLLFWFWPRPLPNREIVFQMYSPDLPASSAEQGDFGFVNADGTKRVNFHNTDFHSSLPVWSPGGSIIAYRWSHAVYYDGVYEGKVIIDRSSTGLFYLAGKDCTRRTWGRGRIRWTPDGRHLIISKYSEEGDRIVLINPANCEITQVLLQAAAGEHLLDPDLSVHGELAYSVKRGEEREQVVVMNLGTGEQRVLGEGINPAWSPDAQWLAYTGYDGLYVVRPDGTGRRRVLDCPTRYDEGAWDRLLKPELPPNLKPPVWYVQLASWGWPPRPEWSPDGRWLVYHRLSEKTESGLRYSIFKLNLETGEEIKVVDDGINPHWRWNKLPLTGS